MYNKLIFLKKNNDFFKYWVGYTFSLVGTCFTTIVLNILVWNVTKSGFFVSISLGLKMLPTVIIGPFLGTFIDGLNNKELMKKLNITSAFLVIIPIITVNPYWIAFYSFLSGIVLAMIYPCMQTLIPDLIFEEKDYIEGNSLISLSKTSAQLLGPLIGASIMELFGANICFSIDAITYIIAFIMIMYIKKEFTCNEKHKVSVLEDLKGGISYIISSSLVRTILILISLLLIVDGALEVSLLIFVKEVLNMNDIQYGLIVTIQGIGMVVASIFVNKVTYKIPGKNMIFIGGLLKVIFTVLLVYSWDFYTVAFIAIISSFFWVCVTVVENSLVQSEVPSKFRGRVFSIYGSFAWLASFMSMVITGRLIDVFGVVNTITIECVCIGILFIVVYWIVNTFSDTIFKGIHSILNRR